MKKRLLSIILFFPCFIFSVLAQNSDIDIDVNILKSCSWTDGFEFVKYASPNEAKQMFDITLDKQNTLFLIGGTLHEGGSCLFLKYDDNTIQVDNHIQYQLFPVGDKVTFDKSKKVLLFRDGKTNSLHGILKPLIQPKDLSKMMCDNMLRFGLAGKYKDQNGKTYQFSEDKYMVEGLSVKNNQFKFGFSYEMPKSVLVFEDVSFGVVKVANYLYLVPVVYNKEYDNFESCSNKKILKLERILSPMEAEYPLLSEEFLTKTEIVLYGGDPYSSVSLFKTEDNIKSLVETLSKMRNEIFARHGYIFNRQKWKTYFGSKAWYKPDKKDVSNELTEIEKVNIEHIKNLEQRFSKELEDF